MTNAKYQMEIGNWKLPQNLWAFDNGMQPEYTRLPVGCHSRYKHCKNIRV
jgi:hypothetical protein